MWKVEKKVIKQIYRAFVIINFISLLWQRIQVNRLSGLHTKRKLRIKVIKSKNNSKSDDAKLWKSWNHETGRSQNKANMKCASGCGIRCVCFFCVDDYFFKLFCDCIFLESPETHFWFLFLDEYKSREPNLFIFFCSVYFSVFLSCWIKHVKAVRNKNNGKRIPNQASLLECFSIMRGCISVWLLLFYRRDRNAFPL